MINPTALHLAVIKNDLQMVDYLLSKGAKIDAKTDIGMTPLAFAAVRGNKEMMDALISRGADIHATKIEIHPDIRKQLQEKQKTNKILPIEYFGGFDVSKFDNEINIALCAAINGQVETVLHCLDNGINPAAVFEEGFTLSHIAIYIKNKRLIQELINRQINLNTTCNYNPSDRKKITNGLGVAVLSGDMETINLVAKNIRGDLDKNAIPAMVIALENNSSEIINTLLLHDPEQNDLKTTTVSLEEAAFNAYENKNLLNIILSNLNEKNLHRLLRHAIMANDYKLVDQLLSEDKASIESVSMTTVVYLSYMGEAEMLKQLLKYGLDIFISDSNYGCLPQIAFKSLEKEKIYPVVMESFRNENKHRINETINDNSFLTFAIINKKDSAIREILAAGANPDPEGNMMNLKMAAGFYPPAIKTLIEYGHPFDPEGSKEEGIMILINLSTQISDNEKQELLNFLRQQKKNNVDNKSNPSQFFNTNKEMKQESTQQENPGVNKKI